VFFCIWGGVYAGVSNFAITAMQLQFGVGVALASSAIAVYMVANAGGMVAGGILCARFPRHDLVAVAGMSIAGLAVLVIAVAALPGTALPIALGLAGFAAGISTPSRDLIVRAATPPGAAGRVYGFAYSGLDVGALATPIFYGMMIDHGMPQGVFYAIFGFTVAATFVVLLVPAGRPAIQRT
jgi:MFS family permease